ncbi:MAG: hypothetical protein WC644_05360 [Ignavibacteria bacterium]
MITQYGENNVDYTLITAFIDNECSIDEKEFVIRHIESDSNFRMHYEFEKGFTAYYRKHFRKSQPSEDIIKKIKNNIDSETKRRKELIKKNKDHKFTVYFYLYPVAAALVLFLGYYIYNSLYTHDSDFVHLSHDLFSKYENNEIQLQHVNSNALELQKILSGSAGFSVFVPELKDAVLIGGTVNELNDEKVVHFIHRKNDKLIYTMQMNRKDLMDDDKLVLHKNHRQEIADGHNWIECEKNNNDCTVIWFRNGVICSSVSKLDAKEIAFVLTNYK